MIETKIAQFVHIEKNAGTSVRAALEQSVGPEHVYVYSPQAERFAPSSSDLQPQTSFFIEQIRHLMSHPFANPILVRLWPIVNSYYKTTLQKRYPADTIPSDAKVVMGHFKADQFDEFFSECAPPIRSIIIRNPYDRMKSHYEHWKRNRGRADWRVKMAYSDTVSFEDFAMKPELRNYQSQALGKLHLSDFDVIGVTEHTDEFIQQLIASLLSNDVDCQIPETYSHRLNMTHQRTKMPKKTINDLEFQENFRAVHSMDFNLYQEALSLSQTQGYI